MANTLYHTAGVDVNTTFTPTAAVANINNTLDRGDDRARLQDRLAERCHRHRRPKPRSWLRPRSVDKVRMGLLSVRGLSV